VDASHPKAKAHIAAVNEVLEEIGAAGRPSVLVFNKCDRLDARELARLRESSRNAVLISAATGAGIPDLLTRLGTEAARGEIAVTALVPYTSGELVQLLHERGRIISEEYTPTGTLITARVPASVAARVAALQPPPGEPPGDEA